MLSDIPKVELDEIEAVISGAQCRVNLSDGLIQKGYESEPLVYTLQPKSKPFRKSSKLKKLRLGKRNQGGPRCINKLKDLVKEPGFSK